MGKRILLNDQWLFHLGDDPGADFMGYDDRAWRQVTLPHDWSVEHPFDKKHASGTGYLPGGTAWYRKHFILPEDVSGKRVRVTFGGVYKHARVYINSNYLGFRAYGYSTFTFDISDFIRPGKNVLSVRVEHEEAADSRWFTGSGIYRDVTLEISDRCAFATDGVFVWTESVDETGLAELKIEYQTLGADGVSFTVLDGEGKVCACIEEKTGAGVCSLSLPGAKLWSPENPDLYTLNCKALQNGEITDEVNVTFGVRTFRFDPDQGFFLNGVSMKLKGVCVHHDGGCLGAAVPKAVWERRLMKFKDAGCNAIRTAHNPPDPCLLDLCDEMGFLVMDEAFDEWEGAKNKWWQGHNVYPPKRFGYAEDFPLWHKADLEAMVLRDRNHPSVILWSIGNEIDYPNDPYVTPLFTEVLGNNDAGKPQQERKYDDRKPDAARLTVIAKELVDIIHQKDATRPVLSALSFPELSTRTGFADVLDLSGYNYREGFYEEDHKRFPDRVLLGSENGHDPAAWYAVRDKDYISGQFLWTGIDFLGECRGWPLRISQAGLLDLCGNEKPLYYRRKALWTDTPFVKIAVSKGEREHTNVWTDTFDYSGTPGEKMQISVYTNAEKAALYINGRSLGEKTLRDADGCRVTWEVPFEAGCLKAVVPGGEDILISPSDAEKISLTPFIGKEASEIKQIEVSLLDKNGNTVTDNDRILFYQLLGDGEILGIENGKPDDLTPYAATYRATYRGRAIVYLRVFSGEISLYVSSRDGLNAQFTIHNS